jgi:hypothetical protein
MFDLRMSGGGNVYTEPTPADKARDGMLTTTYTTWLEFDRGLTIAVDNMLAQVESGNQDIIHEANRYFHVGLEVLQRLDGISFNPPQVTASSHFHSLFISTTLSDWSYSSDWPASRIPGLLREASPTGRSRWRAKISNASLSFNSSQPKKMDVSATLELEVEQEVSPGAWLGAPISLQKVGGFQNDLKGKITLAYDDYLRKRFGVDTDSPQFRGIRALSAVAK